MKKVLILILVLAMSLTAFGLTACGGKKEEEEKNNLVVYDLENKADVEVEIPGKPSSIFQVVVGSSPIEESFYKYSNGKLTIKKDRISDKHSKDKVIKVVPKQGDEAIKFRLVIADKIIKTPQDFQAINDNLDGIYVLGADIDFSTFGNFNPIGNNAEKRAGDKIGKDFTGALIGAGHTISNLSANADDLTDDEIYTFYGDDGNGIDVPPDSHYDYIRPCYGIFLRNLGLIEGVCFKNCTIKNTYGTIMGVVCAVNEAEIKNVIVDGGEVLGGPIWLDYNCMIGGVAGINGGNAKITNCISMVKTLKANAEQGNSLARYFCGKTWGKIENCYACKDGITLQDLATDDIPKYNDKGELTDDQGIIGSATAPELGAATGFGFTYIATETIAHTQLGSFEGCGVKTLEELKSAELYGESFDKTVWSITDGDVPTLKIIYPVAAK